MLYPTKGAERDPLAEIEKGSIIDNARVRINEYNTPLLHIFSPFLK